MEEPAPGQVVGHEGGALGEGDDEDEVEEELERLDTAPFAELGTQVGTVLGGATLDLARGRPRPTPPSAPTSGS